MCFHVPSRERGREGGARIAGVVATPQWNLFVQLVSLTLSLWLLRPECSACHKDCQHTNRE